jgi:hypothetical protein
MEIKKLRNDLREALHGGITSVQKSIIKEVQAQKTTPKREAPTTIVLNGNAKKAKQEVSSKPPTDPRSAEHKSAVADRGSVDHKTSTDRGSADHKTVARKKPTSSADIAYLTRTAEECFRVYFAQCLLSAVDKDRPAKMEDYIKQTRELVLNDPIVPQELKKQVSTELEILEKIESDKNVVSKACYQHLLKLNEANGAYERFSNFIPKQLRGLSGFQTLKMDDQQRTCYFSREQIKMGRCWAITIHYSEPGQEPVNLTVDEYWKRFLAAIVLLVYLQSRITQNRAALKEAGIAKTDSMQVRMQKVTTYVRRNNFAEADAIFRTVKASFKFLVDEFISEKNQTLANETKIQTHPDWWK